MSLLTIIIVLVVVGIVLWLINAYVPMDPTVKKILNIVIIVFLVIWLLKKAFGVWGEPSKVRVQSEPIPHHIFTDNKFFPPGEPTPHHIFTVFNQ